MGIEDTSMHGCGEWLSQNYAVREREASSGLDMQRN